MEPKPGDDYILIEPVTETFWVAQRCFIGQEQPDPEKARPENRYKSLEAAIKGSEKKVDKSVLGLKVRTAPTGGRADVATSFDEETMIKVWMAFQKHNVPIKLATDIVHEMQNEGILFRERSATVDLRAGLDAGERLTQPYDPNDPDIVDESGVDLSGSAEQRDNPGGE